MRENAHRLDDSFLKPEKPRNMDEEYRAKVQQELATLEASRTKIINKEKPVDQQYTGDVTAGLIDLRTSVVEAKESLLLMSAMDALHVSATWVNWRGLHAPSHGEDSAPSGYDTITVSKSSSTSQKGNPKRRTPVARPKGRQQGRLHHQKRKPPCTCREDRT